MPTRGETDNLDDDGVDQYDDQVAAYPLEITVTVEQDIKEKVESIYKIIRSEHGQENVVLCQTGDPIISMNLELINSDLILPSLPYTSHAVLSIIVVHMIKSSRSIDDIRMVLRDYLLNSEVEEFMRMLEEGTIYITF